MCTCRECPRVRFLWPCRPACLASRRVESVQHMSLDGMETAQLWLGNGERKQVSWGRLKLLPTSCEALPPSVAIKLDRSELLSAALVVRAQHAESSTVGSRCVFGAT